MLLLSGSNPLSCVHTFPQSGALEKRVVCLNLGVSMSSSDEAVRAALTESALWLAVNSKLAGSQVVQASFSSQCVSLKTSPMLQLGGEGVVLQNLLQISEDPTKSEAYAAFYWWCLFQRIRGGSVHTHISQDSIQKSKDAWSLAITNISAPITAWQAHPIWSGRGVCLLRESLEWCSPKVKPLSNPESIFLPTTTIPWCTICMLMCVCMHEALVSHTRKQSYSVVQDHFALNLISSPNDMLSRMNH